MHRLQVECQRFSYSSVSPVWGRPCIFRHWVALLPFPVPAGALSMFDLNQAARKPRTMNLEDSEHEDSRQEKRNAIFFGLERDCPHLIFGEWCPEAARNPNTISKIGRRSGSFVFIHGSQRCEDDVNQSAACTKYLVWLEWTRWFEISQHCVGRFEERFEKWVGRLEMRFWALSWIFWIGS